MEPEKEILLKEYEQGVSMCKWTEQLTRSSITIYVAVAAAIFAVAFRDKPDAGQISMLLLGAIVSLLLGMTIYRTRAYYKSYLDRCKSIEKNLGMGLLSGGEDLFGKEQFRKRPEEVDSNVERFVSFAVGWPAEHITNKLAFLLVTVIGAIAFVLLLIIRICQMSGG
jgi:hypothetical protein